MQVQGLEREISKQECKVQEGEAAVQRLTLSLHRANARSFSLARSLARSRALSLSLALALSLSLSLALSLSRSVSLSPSLPRSLALSLSLCRLSLSLSLCRLSLCCLSLEAAVERLSLYSHFTLTYSRFTFTLLSLNSLHRANASCKEKEEGAARMWTSHERLTCFTCYCQL